MENMPFEHKERLDVEKARYILGLPQERLIDDIYDAEERNQDGKQWDMDAYFHQLKCYLKEVVKREGVYHQSYKYSKTMKTKGRQYVKNFGIQSLQRDIRGFLCSKYYNDYDIVNAHPCILNYIKKTFFPELKLPCLEKYINERDNILQQWDITKKDVLVRINSEKMYPTDKTFLIRLHKEIIILQDAVWNCKHEKISKITKTLLKTADNKKGRFLNRVACVFENEIIRKAVAAFNTADIGSLMFDGFFINKQLSPDEVIEKLQQATQEYGVKWSVKEHSEKIVVNPALVLPPEYEETDYELKKKKFEENHFIILDPLMFVREYEDKTLSVYNWMNFRKVVAPIKYKDHKYEEVPFADDWVDDENRREYKKFVFDPLNNDNNYYNLFTGFKFTNVIPENEREQEHVDMFVNHVKYLVRNEEETYEYILNYCAHLIQKPQERPDVCIVFNGAQGTGKDTFISILQNIIGKDYVTRESRMERIFGNFNSSLNNKLILQINEMEGINGVKYEQLLKDLITTDTLTINRKMKEPYEIDNLLRIFICSNGDNPIKMVMDNRRYFVAETATKSEIKPPEYYEDLNEAIKDECFLESVFSYLKTKDISDFKPRQFPETEKMKIMKEHSVNPIYYFLNDNFTTKDHIITCKEMLRQYKEFCITEGYKTEYINAKSVKSIMVNIENDAIRHTNRPIDGRSTRVYVINSAVLKKELKHKIPQ